MNRLIRAGYWLLPVLYLAWLYRWGLQAWFQQDDFAWLGLPLHVNGPADIWDAFFTPRAQGTIRPLSERLFFYVFATVSWLDPRPFHVCVFVTACAVLFFLMSLTLRLTGSRAGALAAPILWLSGIGPANPLSWLSSYNQVLESFFLVATLFCLVKAAESGSRRWWLAQWFLFLLGFGALEIHVVYPFLALTYAALFARGMVRRVLWMIPVSVAYAGLHFAFVPKPTEGPYLRHWDLSIFSTLFKYFGMALGAGQVLPGSRLPAESWLWAAWTIGLALAGWAGWVAWRRGSYAALFGILWFFIVLGPTLPLRDHIMEYYLTTPALGLAIACGAAVGAAVTAPWLWRGAVLGLLALHLVFVLPVNRTITRWRYDRGLRIQALVEGLERAANVHRGRIILLTGIDSELFWSCLLDSPARLFGAQEVYLAPGADQKLDTHVELGDIAAYVADPGLAGRALVQRSAVVYEFDGRRLRNITKKYRREIPQDWLYQRPRIIDAAHPAFTSELGEGWNESDGSLRWMTRRAVIFLAPARQGDHLFLTGYLPTNRGERPTVLRIYLNGRKLSERPIRAEEEQIESNLPVPNELVGQPAELVLELDRAIRLPGDPTEYGLAFGKIGFR